MLLRLLLLIGLMESANYAFCQDIKAEVEIARKEILRYERNSTERGHLTKALDAVTLAKVKAGKAIGPEIWKLEAKLFHHVAAEQLLISQAARRPSQQLLAVKSPALQAYDAYLSLLQIAGRKKKKEILADLSALQRLMLSISVQDLQRKRSRKRVWLQHRAILSLHHLLKEAKLESVIDSCMPWFTYQLALAAYYREDIDTYAPLSLSLYEQGFRAPGLYLMLYEASARKGTRGMAIRYLSEGRTKFPLHGDLMEAELKYFFERQQLPLMKKRYEKQSEDQWVNMNHEHESILFYTKLSKIHRSLRDTIGAELNFKLTLDKIQAQLNKDPTNYLANLGAVRLYYDQFLVLVDELLIVGEDCSRSAMRRYGVIRDRIDEVLNAIPPYLDCIIAYGEDHIEILEISRTISMVEADIERKRKYGKALLRAKLNPKNWHTHVIRQEWW